MKDIMRRYIYLSRISRQISVWCNMIIHPNRFAWQLQEEKGINVLMLAFIFLINLLGKIGFKEVEWKHFLLNTACSIILLTGVLMILTFLAKGKVKLCVVLNLALYIHIFYVVINLSKNMGVAVLFIHIIVRMYTITFQKNVMKEIFKCDLEMLDNIIIIEICIVAYGWMNLLMKFYGYRLATVEKFVYFPLLG